MNKTFDQFTVNVSENKVCLCITQMFAADGKICGFELKDISEEDDEDDDLGIEITQIVMQFNDEFAACKKAYEEFITNK